MTAANVTPLIRPPRLRPVDGRASERHASWLELFFDLVFVVAVSELTQRFSSNLTLGGFWEMVGLFVPVLWTWITYTFYADRFDTDDIVFRLMMFAGMLTIAALAVTIHDAIGDGARAFALAYVCARVVLIAMYERARRAVPEARELCTRYVCGFTIGAGIWLISAFVPEPACYLLWGLGIAIELATPVASLAVVSRVPIDASHIPERFGLFVIVVLGEAILSVATGVAGTDWQARSTIVAAMGFAIAASLWWINFDFIQVAVIQETSSGRRLAWVYGHLPIVIALTLVAVGVEQAILGADAGELGRGASWSLAGGPALYFASTLILRTVSVGATRYWVTLGFIAALVTLAATGEQLPPVALTGLVTLVLTTKVAAGVIAHRATAAGAEYVPLEFGVGHERL